MKPTRALSLITDLSLHHQYGHTCVDGKWHNPRTGTKAPCAVLARLGSIAADVTALHAQVHQAAHNPTQVDMVASAMLSTPLTELDPEQQEGWRHLARLAIEALAHELDRDLERESRATAVQERLAVARG